VSVFRFLQFVLSVTCLGDTRYSVGANSFALKIRHGFPEGSLKPSSNFISGKKVLEPIVNIGVHIVRMNSHLQMRTSLFTQTGYTHLFSPYPDTRNLTPDI